MSRDRAVPMSRWASCHSLTAQHSTVSSGKPTREMQETGVDCRPWGCGPVSEWCRVRPTSDSHSHGGDKSHPKLGARVYQSLVPHWWWVERPLVSSGLFTIIIDESTIAHPRCCVSYLLRPSWTRWARCPWIQQCPSRRRLQPIPAHCRRNHRNEQRAKLGSNQMACGPRKA